MCRKSLLVLNPEPHHIFTTFKEFNDQIPSLNYVTFEFIKYIAHVHDCTLLLLKLFGHHSDIFFNIKHMLLQHTDFSFFVCSEHKQNVQSIILNNALKVFFSKFVKDNRRDLQEN